MDKNKKDLKIVKLEMTLEEKLKKVLNKLKKECIRVMPVKAGFEPEHAIDTRFAGPAYAEKDDKIPVCECCGKPLTFIFQYREKYDEEMNPKGALYSLYYCFDCVPIGRQDEEKGQWAIISHNNPDVKKFVEQKENISSRLTPTTCSLSKIFVLPDYETIENNYPEISFVCEEIDPEDPMSAYEEAGTEIGCLMEPSTTIGGYPIWIQGEGCQECPQCKEKGELAVQIDSEEAVNLMFGDAGCLYVFKCPKHEKGFALEMQCF